MYDDFLDVRKSMLLTENELSTCLEDQVNHNIIDIIDESLYDHLVTTFGVKMSDKMGMEEDMEEAFDGFIERERRQST